MTDQLILNLSLAHLARLGKAKEFKSNMLKKQYLIKRDKSLHQKHKEREREREKALRNTCSKTNTDKYTLTSN